MTDGRGADRLLTPGEVAAMFRVDPKTVTRWAAAGRLSSLRTPGGHRRFWESEVRALLAGPAEPVIPEQATEQGADQVAEQVAEPVAEQVPEQASDGSSGRAQTADLPRA